MVCWRMGEGEESFKKCVIIVAFNSSEDDQVNLEEIEFFQTLSKE